MRVETKSEPAPEEIVINVPTLPQLAGRVSTGLAYYWLDISHQCPFKILGEKEIQVMIDLGRRFCQKVKEDERVCLIEKTLSAIEERKEFLEIEGRKVPLLQAIDQARELIRVLNEPSLREAIKLRGETDSVS